MQGSHPSPGSVRDKHIDYVQERILITPQSIVTGQVTGASTVLTLGFGSGTPNLVQIGSTHVPAYKLAATTDEIDFVWYPTGVDNSRRIFIRHLWTSDYGTANGTATFLTKYNANKIGAAPAKGATGLTVAHAAATKVAATADAMYWTPSGIIGPLATGSIAYQTLDPDTVSLSINVVCSAVTGITIASDFVYWLGCEIAYTPKKTFGNGSQREARQMASYLRTQEQIATSVV